jgi:hypothetical protein
MPNWGLDHEGLRSGRPIIGIARTRYDLSPDDRQHLARDDHWGHAAVTEDAVTGLVDKRGITARDEDHE